MLLPPRQTSPVSIHLSPLTSLFSHLSPSHFQRSGVMTGSIDRILDVGDGDYRLRVAPVYADDSTPSHVAPDLNPPLATRRWQHHRFNLWEHVSRPAAP